MKPAPPVINTFCINDTHVVVDPACYFDDSTDGGDFHEILKMTHGRVRNL
jgi:fructosamine-3-kinase